MPTPTTRLAIPKPLASEPPNGPAQISAVADALDNAAIDLPEGLLSARPAPSIRGRYFYATDTAILYRDSGATWRAVSVGVDAITATQIAAGAVGNSELAASAVDNSKVSATAAIAESKLALASDAAAGTASRRTLGSGATQAAPGNDARLSDQRVPTDGSVTLAKLAAAIVERLWDVGDIKGVAYNVTAGSEPSGWLLCDGRAVTRTGLNAALFAKIQTAHGAGDGSTTFNLPDYRGRTLVGKGTHAEVDTIGETDGLAVGSRTPRHIHTVDPHSHTVNPHNHGNATGSIIQPAGADVTSGPSAQYAIPSGSGSTFSAATGSGSPANTPHTHTIPPHFHGIVNDSPGTSSQSPGTDAQGPPYSVVNYLVKM